MKEKLYLEEEMEQELIKRGHNIFDEDECIDSVEVCEIAVGMYGFKSRLNKDEILEFTGNFSK